MILETERLILRPLVEADAESIFEYAKDPMLALWQAGQRIKACRRAEMSSEKF